MAGRPAGLSDDDTDSEDEFFRDFQMPISKMSNNNNIIRSRQNNTGPSLVNKEPPSRMQIDLDEFRLAAMKGNFDKMKSFIAAGVQIDQILRSGWTALMYAASSGQWKVVEYLTENQANPNFHKELFTPLMAACASSHEDEEDLLQTVEILIRSGAKVNAAERHRVTPLMFASKEKRLKLVQILLENAANPNLQDNRGWTALMWAAERGDGAIVRTLMEHRDGMTDINLISAGGQKAVDIALAANNRDIAALLDHSFKTTNKEPILESVKEFSELDATLMGLELSHLIPVFQQHGMDFHTFLLLDEQDLDLMGIKEVGFRTKLLSAVKEIHMKEWKRDSLPAIHYSKYLSCPEATSLMGNLALHSRYMEASVAYLRDQIQRRPRLLQLGMETASVHALAAQTQFAQKYVQGLHDQLKFLKLFLDKVQDKAEFVPADLITEKIISPSARAQKRMNWIRYLALFVVVLTGGVALLRTPSLFVRPSTVVLVV